MGPRGGVRSREAAVPLANEWRARFRATPFLGHGTGRGSKASMPRYALTVNGLKRSVEASPDTPLLWVLRDTLGLTGTKYGCGEGQCGACTVHMNGQAIRSCTTPIQDAAGKTCVTIEGLSTDGSHPVQRAWIEEDVAQCGYCQVGMIMETAALLRSTPQPNDKEVDEALATHICRCGTYNRLRAAVKRAAEMTPRSSRS